MEYAPEQLQCAREIRAIAMQFRELTEGIPAVVHLSVVAQESAFNPGAYNVADPNGSYGPYQLNQSPGAHPGTWFVAVNPWYNYGFPEVYARWRDTWVALGGAAAWSSLNDAQRGGFLAVFAPRAQGSIAWTAELGQQRYVEGADILAQIGGALND